MSSARTLTALACALLCAGRLSAQRWRMAVASPEVEELRLTLHLAPATDPIAESLKAAVKERRTPVCYCQ